MWFYIALSSIILNVLTIYILIVKFKLIYKQSEYISDLEDMLVLLNDRIKQTYTKMMQIDTAGYYKNSDYTGMIFRSLKEQIEVMWNFVQEQMSKDDDGSN